MRQNMNVPSPDLFMQLFMSVVSCSLPGLFLALLELIICQIHINYWRSCEARQQFSNHYQQFRHHYQICRKSAYKKTPLHFIDLKFVFLIHVDFLSTWGMNPWPTGGFRAEYLYLKSVSCKRVKMPPRYFLYSALIFSQSASAKLSPKLASTCVQENYRMLQKTTGKFVKHWQDFQAQGKFGCFFPSVLHSLRDKSHFAQGSVLVEIEQIKTFFYCLVLVTKHCS